MGSIKNRTLEATFEGEFSHWKYEVVASRHIIQEIDDAIRKVENKYPKEWEYKLVVT